MRKKSQVEAAPAIFAQPAKQTAGRLAQGGRESFRSHSALEQAQILQAVGRQHLSDRMS